MIRLRRECNPVEAYEVASFLKWSPLNKSLGMLPDFPARPVRAGATIFLTPTSLPNELAFQRVMLEANATKLCRFFEAVGKLNTAVFSRRPADIAKYIDAIRKEYGFSYYLLNKVISIKYLFPNDDPLQVAVQNYLVAYNKPKREIVAVVLEDCVDPTRSYALTRKTVSGYLRDNRFGPSATRIITSQLRVIPENEEDASGALQASAMNSVIDAQFYLWSRSHYLKELLGKQGRHLELAVAPDVANAISRSAIGFDQSIFEDSENDGGGFDEFNLLRHSNGWMEYQQVALYRCAVERAFGKRLDGSNTSRRFTLNPAEPIVKPASLIQLSEGSYSGSINLQSIDPSTGGYLHRVIGLMQVIDRGNEQFDFAGEQLLALLNKTLDVPMLANSSELSSFMSARRNDTLYQYLRAAVIKDCEETARSEHMLRKATQAVIRDRFGDITDFLKFLYASGRHVGGHFYGTCSEPFLVQLYGLFDTANDVVEARARLLEVYGSLEGNDDAIDRAKALRLELKLSKVRDDIDDNRIYIDPLRFHQWLIETLGDDLRAAIPVVSEWSQNITSGADLSNPIALMENPELRLGKILDVAYHEFCANKFFGVDSYIGRRIRHGTLKGVMVTEIKSILDDAALQTNAPELVGFFQSWFEKYEKVIAIIGDEILQLREEGKSSGGIVPSIAVNNKLAIARLAVMDIATALEHESPVQYAISAIQDHCWRLLETDLLRIRAEIQKMRSDQLLIDLAAIPSGDGNQAVSTELARKLNEAVQRKFTTLCLWLSQPKNVSPSATISLLFNAVLIEVAEQNPGFKPLVAADDILPLELYGHRYHYVYDLLYVLVNNAGRHGKKDGVLSFDVEVDSTGTTARIVVGSDICEDETMDEVREMIDSAMRAEVEDAFKIDKFSGIKKIRAIEAHLSEFKNFKVSYEGRRIFFSAELALTAM